jgi:hypothetical protein
MNKKLLITATAIFSIAVFSFLNTENAHSNAGAAPAGHTGSPGDGRSCATSGCHTGLTVQNQENLITSNIPLTGYLPGETYTITATVVASGVTRFGFQVSPQFTNGQLAGTLIATNSTETALVGSGKYITQRLQGTSGAGQRSWSFDWVAPASGSGSLAFYGAFNATNNNGGSSGDQIILSALTVSEDLTSASVSLLKTKKFKFYPNPASDQIFIESRASNDSFASLELMDLSGKSFVSKRLKSENGKFNLKFDNPSGIPSGVYLLLFESNGEKVVQQILIRH